MSSAPSGLVSPVILTSLYPHARPPDTIPTFVTPSALPVIAPVWEHAIVVLMKMPNSTAEEQNMRAWVTDHSLSSLEGFLMWELVHLQYGDITVCIPSRDPSKPDALVSLKINPIRYLVMLWKYIPPLGLSLPPLSGL